MAPRSRSFPLLSALALGWLLGWASHGWWRPDAPAEDIDATLATAPTVPAPAAGGQLAELATDDTPLPGSGVTAPPPRRYPLDEMMGRDDKTAALDWLARLREDEEPRWQRQLQRLKTTLADWLEAGRSDAVLGWTEAFLERFYYDPDILQLKAAAHLDRHESLLAIQSLFLQLQRGNDASAAPEVRRQIDLLIQDYRQALQEERQWPALQALYEYLVVVEPNHAGHYLHLAIVLAEQGKEADARLALNHVYGDPEHGDAALALRKRLDQARMGEVRIPLQRTGEQFAVTGLLNERNEVSLLIDTGASLSALSRSAFNQLKDQSSATYVGKLVVQTANGEVEAPRYRFRSLALAGITLRDVDMLVMDNLPPGQGLLGMNVLGQFPFRIDQKNAILMLNEP